MTTLSTTDVGNKYEADIKWPTKVKLNHPRPLNTTREARTAHRTNSYKTAPSARYQIAVNYAQLTRAIFHYYDSILASHNRTGVATGPDDHYSSITPVQVFSPATLTAAPMRGAHGDKIVNYNPIPWLLRLDRWKGLMWDGWCYIVNISNEMIALSHRNIVSLWLTSIFIICGQPKIVWGYLLQRYLKY